MDDSGEVPLFWGHGPIEPDCVHVRETRAGQPVADRAEDGWSVGFAICGCLLIADVAEHDVTSGAYRRCIRCVGLLAGRVPGVDYPLWSPE